MNPENTERVKRQKEAPIKVIIGNPPYNAGQINENDNNKNRKYAWIDKRVKNTYGTASKATLLRKLNDPYIKSFRWATDRLEDHGIISFISNNGFLDDATFDGLRKIFPMEFDELYFLDLGGNVRRNPKLSGTTHNVFGIQVGVCISILIRKSSTNESRSGQIYYARVGETWRRGEKYDFLDSLENHTFVNWKKIKSVQKQNWLIETPNSNYRLFLPIGNKETKAARQDVASSIFHRYCLGVSTNRDAVVYDFNSALLEDRTR